MVKNGHEIRLVIFITNPYFNLLLPYPESL